MHTSLAAALAALDLGHLEPRTEDLSGMAAPSTEALEQTTTAIWSDLFVTLFNTSLERDIEELGWGLVNLFYRAASKKHATIDRLTDEIRLLLADQDGSETNTAKLEEKIDLAKKIEEAAGCYEHMCETAAAHYLRETGRSWIPATGNRISLGVTSAIVDGRAFLRARRERIGPGASAPGPLVFCNGRATVREGPNKAQVKKSWHSSPASAKYALRGCPEAVVRSSVARPRLPSRERRRSHHR